jgi:hypothetical protein
MQDPKGCRVCETLWVMFAQATARYAKLVLDQQRGDAEDPQRRAAEESEILVAAKLRQQIRERLESHEVSAHHKPGRSAATASVRTE